MTRLTYVLFDGTITTSYAEAVASGKPYTRRFEPIKKAMTTEERERAKRKIAIIREKARQKQTDEQ